MVNVLRLRTTPGSPRATMLAAACLVVAMVSACSTPLSSVPTTPGPVDGWCCTDGEEALVLEYLGVGGWLFRLGDASIMTAPFFSNPRMLDVGLGRLEPDTVVIERYLPAVEDIKAILVGHAHYDHLMDVPYVMRTRAPQARMYGSRTAVNLLRADPALDSTRLVSVEETAGDDTAAGEWHYVEDGRIRFMALRSGHAPHFLGIHLYEGRADEPADELPGRAGDWVEGRPLAYLIDFLSVSGEVTYRIHYQDAASSPPDGFPPSIGDLDGVPVDLAILCAPGYEEVDGYPEMILERLEPTHVLVGHWEDFFRTRDEDLEAVPGTDLEEFIERMESALPYEARWAMPEPGSVITIQTGRAP